MSDNPDTLLGIPIVWSDDVPAIKADEIVLTNLPSEIRIRTGVALQELVALLESLKIEHYTTYTGLDDCDSTSYRRPGKCDCGADEHNASIDAMIKRLTQEELTKRYANEEFRRAFFSGDEVQEPVGIIKTDELTQREYQMCLDEVDNPLDRTMYPPSAFGEEHRLLVEKLRKLVKTQPERS